MSYLGWIALLFGAAGVWLTIKQTIWCWPVSLVAVFASIAEFYNERLFGDMALQVFYVFAGLYGWIFWNRKGSFFVNNITPSAITNLIMVTILQVIVYYFLLIRFKGDKPLFDAILTASSLTATYMMTRKWTQNWVAWVLIDIAYVVLYLIKEMWLFAILYLVFAGMAYYGWLKWRRELLRLQ